MGDRWLFGPPEQTCVAITDVSPSTVSVSERAADVSTVVIYVIWGGARGGGQMVVWSPRTDLCRYN